MDASARLPLHILVEEGKHASCTDRNADGQFTPGYDGTERVNDAWGVRDTLGTGRFFTGDYKAWMTKIRRDDTRIFPPLPPDSPLRAEWSLFNAGQELFTMPRIAVIRGMIMNHIIHHRGQLTVYLRLLDVPVPQTYGPTADHPEWVAPDAQPASA